MRSTSRTMDKLTMQRRHFQFIAEVLASVKPGKPTGEPHETAVKVAWRHWEDTVGTFARALSHTNPQFDHSSFLDACGYEGRWGR